MAGVYSHNRDCDRTNWKGEVTLPTFESFVFAEEILDVDPWENYEEAIHNYWPVFIQEFVIE